MFYRYTDDTEAEEIKKINRIEPAPNQICKWFSPDCYDTGSEAQRFLAIRYTPTYRVGPIPSDELADFDHTPLRVVAPAHGQPGGGLEAATTQTVYLFSITRLAEERG
jgi:hypothetical protein